MKMTADVMKIVRGVERLRTAIPHTGRIIQGSRAGRTVTVTTEI